MTQPKRISPGEWAGVYKQTRSREVCQKATQVPKSERAVQLRKFRKKKWVPTTSCATENFCDTSNRNHSASVYEHKYFQHFPFLPTSRQPWLMSGCRRAQCWALNPQRLILCSAQCLAKHCMGTTEQQTWQKAKESPVESKKIFPLWVLKSNRMQLEQQNMLGRSYIEGTCVHTRDSRA